MLSTPTLEVAVVPEATTLTVTIAADPGYTAMLPPVPLGVGTVKPIAVLLQLSTSNGARSPGDPAVREADVAAALA